MNKDLRRTLELAGVICNESEDNLSLDENEQLIYSLAKHAAEILSTKNGFSIEPVTDDCLYYTGQRSNIAGCYVAGSYSGTITAYDGDPRNPDTDEGEVDYAIDDIMLSFEYDTETNQLIITCTTDGEKKGIAKVDDPKSVPNLLDYATKAAEKAKEITLAGDGFDVQTRKGNGGIRAHWYK